MAGDVLSTIEYRGQPAILVHADSDESFARVRKTADLAGLRVARREGLATSEPPLAAPVAATIVELEEAETPALVTLLDRLQYAAELGARTVITAPPGLIDLVAARAPHGSVTHLCAPTEAERVAAFALAAAPREARFHDVGRDGHRVLQQLSEEVGRIANILASLSEDDVGDGNPLAPAACREAEEPPFDAAQIRAMIRARRLRDQYFRADLFADPAWDMLLDLMAARLEKGRVAVSSLCIAAAVPATTALRWIKLLTDRGIFVRQADPQDGRRVYIELSDDTARSLSAYFRAAQRLAPGMI